MGNKPLNWGLVSPVASTPSLCVCSPCDGAKRKKLAEMQPRIHSLRIWLVLHLLPAHMDTPRWSLIAPKMLTGVGA